jgi:chaperonin GroES
MNIKPVEDVILVKAEYDKEKQRKSGIIIPSTAENNKIEIGTVIAVGPGKKDKNGEYISVHVEVGQKILYYISSAIEIIENGEKYHFIDDTVALAVYTDNDNVEISTL